MLSANVLCLKKKKKRTYSLSNAAGKGFGVCNGGDSRAAVGGGGGGGNWKDERSRGSSTVTMMQITEDTPPDMLAGAMDLTVHLPNGKSVKMSVERSTPMMDLLVQITVSNHLQLSKYTLQALGMAPSSQHSDIVLPFKPNTPIGALDTQHIKVLAKEKSLQTPKYVAPGFQPFESTFRLKVHLPKNQLYVTRVSRNVLLEDIMKKVCDEKNLDPKKYEFKHPANPDEVLEPKLTLSDYQITEIYVVAKGTTNLAQTFSTTDIMTLRKEEERKQMHSKTGSGVFNLIFKRGKSNMGSGSVSSDNRSISPIHSDDSRSVTPPAIQPPQVVLPNKNPPPERPRPPQRKRRPAPKPPQQQLHQQEPTPDTSSQNQHSSTTQSVNKPNKPNNDNNNNGLTICHSRNSSDSSGYHEASILSDHASLPRNRPRSAVISTSQVPCSQSTSNLTKMSTHSRSTTSLVTGRRKKAAPPPPPSSRAPAIVKPASSEIPSPLIASHSDIAICKDDSFTKVNGINPSSSCTNTTHSPAPMPRTQLLHQELDPSEIQNNDDDDDDDDDQHQRTPSLVSTISRSSSNDYSIEEMLASMEAINKFHTNPKTHASFSSAMSSSTQPPLAAPRRPEIVRMIPKPSPSPDSFRRSNARFQLGSCNMNAASTSGYSSFDDGSLDAAADDSMFDTGSVLDVSNHLFDTSSFDNDDKDDEDMKKDGELKIKDTELVAVKNDNLLFSQAESKLTSDQTFLLDNYIPSPVESSTPIKNQEKISDSTDSGIAQDVGEKDDYIVAATPPPPAPALFNGGDIDREITIDVQHTNTDTSAVPSPALKAPVNNPPLVETNEIEWQYQLPSPPKAFRDVSPTNSPSEVTTNSVISDFKDSVVTSPELFEKLKTLEDNQSDKESTLKSETTSTISEEPLNTLSLEHLEKRQSLVYNRELSTSLKMTDNNLGNKLRNSTDTFKNCLSDFKATYDELHHMSVTLQQQKQPLKPARVNLPQQHNATLPNFKITTYDVPKQNITVFEDDTIRSNITATLRRKEFGRSMENISFSRKIQDENNDDDEETAPPSHPLGDNVKSNVTRSGSFSTDRVPLKPVSRSKSTLTLNKYQNASSSSSMTMNRGESMSRSNSLFDVSGLQSLEVMKLIQNKLNTPTTSIENVNDDNEEEPSKIVEEKLLINGKDLREVAKTSTEETSPQTTRKYYYRGPPAVNMTTWSERPKVPVAVKADDDYKLGNANHTSSKIIVKTIKTTNDIAERKEKLHIDDKDKTGDESYGNVLIKIRDNRNNVYTKNTENQQQRFIGATAYRKPFNHHMKPTISQSPRPHSVAFGTDFDVSRVPVVRSVEFKKPYKDNTSITHIYQTSPDEIETNNNNSKFSTMFRSTENLQRQETEPVKRVFRINTFKHGGGGGGGDPIVRGFQSTDQHCNNNNYNKRSSWAEPFSYGTLPNRTNGNTPGKEFVTNRNVPFSQMTLRRTESSKFITKPANNDNRNTQHTTSSSSYTSLPPTVHHMKNRTEFATSTSSSLVPSPPLAPPLPPAAAAAAPSQFEKRVPHRKTGGKESSRVASSVSGDARGMLLESIRNFGGAKGLRVVKAS